MVKKRDATATEGRGDLEDPNRKAVSASTKAAALALTSIAVVGLVTACGGAPKGPDGKTLPGGGEGAPPLAEPRGEKPPPTQGTAQIIDLVMRKKAAGAASGETDVVVSGAQLHIKWEKQADGSCKITISAEGATSTTFFVVPAAGGGSEQVKFDDSAFPGVKLYGYHAVFYATAPDCTDLIWAQYFERTALFYNASGNQVGDKHHTGPAIDGQVPYQNESHPGGGGNAWMQDDAGINVGAATSPKDGAPTALGTLKSWDGVTDDTITKADVTWTYWSYEICLNPYKVYGFYKWGYRLTVDVNNDPYIKTSGVNEPKWEATK
jgi:hypothetical protein